jgi:hypothetical protein
LGEFQLELLGVDALGLGHSDATPEQLDVERSDSYRSCALSRRM